MGDADREHFFLGRYGRVRELGRSERSVVILAHDTHLDRRVVIKSFPRLATDAAKREARFAALLQHPHIVTVYDYVEDRDAVYLVMEYVVGRNLAEQVSENGPFSSERTIKTGLMVCEALAFAHACGVLHGDIKPGNILIMPGGGVKVADFGVARVLGQHDGDAAGTLGFTAPEVVQGTVATARSDLYSLGAVMAYMLVGDPDGRQGMAPTVSLDRRERGGASQHTSAWTASLRSDTPLERLVHELLAAEPALRPSSAAEVLARLRAMNKTGPACQQSGEVPRGSATSHPADMEDTLRMWPLAGVPENGGRARLFGLPIRHVQRVWEGFIGAALAVVAAAGVIPSEATVWLYWATLLGGVFGALYLPAVVVAAAWTSAVPLWHISPLTVILMSPGLLILPALARRIPRTVALIGLAVPLSRLGLSGLMPPLAGLLCGPIGGMTVLTVGTFLGGVTEAFPDGGLSTSIPAGISLVQSRWTLVLAAGVIGTLRRLPLRWSLPAIGGVTFIASLNEWKAGHMPGWHVLIALTLSLVAVWGQAGQLPRDSQRRVIRQSA